jgi:hypothetical protein
MKKKAILLFLLIGMSFYVRSQEEITIFKNSLKNSSSAIKDVIPIVNSKNDDFSIFIADAKNVYGYLFDTKYSLKNKLSSIEKNRKYKLLIGNSISTNDDYRLFLSNKNKKEFISINFSFNNQTTDYKEFTLEQPEEKFIQTVTSKNQFYLISASAISNSLFIYTFDNKGLPKRNRINLSGFGFFDHTGKNCTLTDLLIRTSVLKKIEENTPNSIESTSESRKMYVKKNAILFTFDENDKQTQLLKIDLRTFKATLDRIKKPLQQIKRKNKKTNSYINGDYIFTLSATKNIFFLEVINRKTKEIIKQFAATKEEKITFKNTPIIQEGGFFDEYRELETTKQFLRKIYSGKIGVSVQNYNNQYHMRIGGYIEQNSGGMMMPMGFGGMPMGFGGMPIGSIGNISLFFNPSQFAFNSYSNTKSIRIAGLFDSEFNHIEGEMKENAFDKMKSHSKSSNNITDIVFKYKDFFIQGKYTRNSKTYFLRKFTTE